MSHSTKKKVGIAFFIINSVLLCMPIAGLGAPAEYEKGSRDAQQEVQKSLSGSDQQIAKAKTVLGTLARKKGSLGRSDDTLPQESSRRVLDTQVFRELLIDLIGRLDAYSENSSSPSTTTTTSLNMIHLHRPRRSRSGTGHSRRHKNSLSYRHCNLQGLWLSHVAGAAIELHPKQQAGHVEIHTKIFELPDNPYPPFLTSQWTGKGIISQESPTTLTIVFQEHIDGAKENHAKERDNGLGDSDSAPIAIPLPRTAVFVGQCLVCHGNPMLQGSWVVFPPSQTCVSGSGFSLGINNGLDGNEQQGFVQSNTPTTDEIYLLRYY